MVVSVDKAVWGISRFFSNNRKLTKKFAGLASNYEPLVERCGRLRSEVTSGLAKWASMIDSTPMEMLVNTSLQEMYSR